jgi:hypothetical protein
VSLGPAEILVLLIAVLRVFGVGLPLERRRGRGAGFDEDGSNAGALALPAARAVGGLRPSMIGGRPPRGRARADRAEASG